MTQSSSRVTWVTGDPKQLKYAIVCDGSHQVHCNYILFIISAHQLFCGMYLLILANYYLHHHHHLFLKRPFLPRSARVRRFSRYETSPHTPGTLLIQGANKAQSYHPLHILSKFSFYLYISPPPPTRLTPNHLHSYTFHMPKPPQSSTPRHFSHALNTQKTIEDLTSLPIFQGHTTHPSHHHMLCSPQALQILSLHCLCLSHICQHTLDTGPKHLSVHENRMRHGL